MWILNYCAPFIFRGTDNINAYRFIMFSEVFALFIVYFVIVLLYKVVGSNPSIYTRSHPHLTLTVQESAQGNPQINDCS